MSVYACLSLEVEGLQGEEKIYVDVILRNLIQRFMGSDKSSNCVQKCPSDWFSLTNGALPAMSWSCLAPLTSEACHSRWQWSRWRVSLLVKLFLTDVSELNYNGKGIWSEALSVMPWIKETAEYWLQVKTACLSSHFHIRCTETPFTTSLAHNKRNQCLAPTTILKYPLAHAFEICSVPSRSEGSSFSVCAATAYHKAAAPGRVRREETWARRFQWQEHPRAAELLSSEASCPVSVFPTHAVARAKAGSSCEQSKFSQGKFYTSKITIFSGKE